MRALNDEESDKSWSETLIDALFIGAYFDKKKDIEPQMQDPLPPPPMNMNEVAVPARENEVSHLSKFEEHEGIEIKHLQTIKQQSG
jgi:hypothetical protein